MTLFLGTWKIMYHARVPCMTYFASMTPEDDKAESAGVELLGRWSLMGNASGAFVCRAEKHSDVASWLYNWVPMATIEIKPICDDNVARKIILKKNPDFMVDYSNVGDEPKDGETLYMINYKFHSDKKLEGMNTFASLTEEQDKGDAGPCRPLGRWHDLGQGCGMAIAAAKSEAVLFAWAVNWTGICDCTVVPVLTDQQSREVIRCKPDFQSKLDLVRKDMLSEPTSKCCPW